MRKVAVPTVALSMLLSACSTWGPYNTMPRVEDTDLQKRGEKQLEVSVEVAKKRMNGWYNVLEQTHANKEVWDIATRELFFYGSVAFSLASAQLLNDGSDMWKRTRNAGAATAFGADLLSGHYQFETQRTAFRNAMARARCGAFAIANVGTSEERLVLFTQEEIDAIDAKLLAADSASPGFMALYNRLPAAANDFIEKVILRKLEDDLKSASPAKPTLSDISAAMDKWKKDQGKASSAQSALQPQVKPAEAAGGDDKKVAKMAFAFRGDLTSKSLPRSLDGKSVLEKEATRSNFVSAVITFESQLKACEISS